MLERGEITKAEVLVGRFQEFFEAEGIDSAIALEFNQKYQICLGDTIVYRDNSFQIVKSLQGKVRQYVVSNGTVIAQTKKLNRSGLGAFLGDTIVYRDNSFQIVKSLQGKVRQYVVSNGTVIAQTKKLNRSGLGALMDGVFLSEQIGVEKPNLEFFDKVFDIIGDIDRNQIMIVGDSLTSDICGGNRAGIITCWYNPEKAEKIENVHVDYEITNLREVYRILS